MTDYYHCYYIDNDFYNNDLCFFFIFVITDEQHLWVETFYFLTKLIIMLTFRTQ